MITSSLMSATIFIMLWASSNFKNPVKLSMALLIISMMIFLNIYFLSGQVWYPILFFLIFMGGILMMFMILSSTLPNEKSVKSKSFPIFMPVLMICLVWFSSSLSGGSAVSKVVKSILDSSTTMYFMMLLMMMYFLISILMVSMEESPMRTTLC